MLNPNEWNAPWLFAIYHSLPLSSDFPLLYRAPVDSCQAPLGHLFLYLGLFPSPCSPSKPQDHGVRHRPLANVLPVRMVSLSWGGLTPTVVWLDGRLSSHQDEPEEDYEDNQDREEPSPPQNETQKPLSRQILNHPG